MNDYQKNIEAMAKSLALMLAPIVVLGEDDDLCSDHLTIDVEREVFSMINAEYFNDITIKPSDVRRFSLRRAYYMAIDDEFNNVLATPCEQWIRRIQKDDAK